TPAVATAPPSSKQLANRPQGIVSPPATVGRNANTPDQGRPLQATGSNAAAAGRVLRNPAFASRTSSRDLQARALAQSTFQGRFATRFTDARRHQFHRFRPIVIGWVGPLFWPFAY